MTLVALLLVAALSELQPARPSLPPGAVQVKAAALVWRDAPPNLPAGTKIAVLEGNPQSEGDFTVRLRIPRGAALPPHTHPRKERVTVLSGAVEIDFGAPHAKRAFGEGDFYINPAATPHSVTFLEDSVIQITGEGPWAVEMVR